MTSVPPTNSFRNLWDAGYRRLVPIVPPDAELSERSTLFKRMKDGKADGRGKAPGVKGGDGLWRGFDFVRHEATAADLDSWHAMAAGTGIKTGRGLIAIDIDTTDAAAAASLLADAERILGPTAKRYGRAPKVLLPYRLEGDVVYDKVSFETATEPCAIVELLSEGRQFVAQGVHPGTRKPYRWPDGLPAYDDLPVVTPEQLAALFDHFNRTLPKAQRFAAASIDRTKVDQAALAGDAALLESAIAALPNAQDMFPGRADYLNVGYALKGALPSDDAAAFDLWCTWAAKWDGGENDPELMAEDWRRMKPPFALGAGYVYDLAEKHGGWAGRAAQWFDVVEAPAAGLFDTPPAAAKRARLVLLDSDEAADTALDGLAAPLVKGLLDQGAMTVLYGDSNVGKTFVAMDLAHHVACGRPYAGKKTAAGLVLYVAAEGGLAAKRRVRALREKYGAAGGRFKLVVSPVNLRDPNADIGPLLELIAGLAERPVLIVIDTLSRAMAGGDENSSVDMGALVAAFDAIRAATGAHLIVVHHTGKDAAKGARGHSLLRAATDTELEVADGRISATKQRDLEGAWASGFRLEVRVLGMDADGDPVTSCTVQLGDVAEVRVGVPSAAESDVLDAIKIIKSTSPAGAEKGVSVASLIRFFADNLSVSMSGNAIRAYLSRLVAKRLVDKHEKGGWDVKKLKSQHDETEAQHAESGCFA